MKSKGLGKTLHRDLMMEELLAIVSYTEFASWWEAIYNRRERIKSYVKDKGQNEDLEVSWTEYQKQGPYGERWVIIHCTIFKIKNKPAYLHKFDLNL